MSRMIYWRGLTVLFYGGEVARTGDEVARTISSYLRLFFTGIINMHAYDACQTR